jgi:hypothetical protein
MNKMFKVTAMAFVMLLFTACITQQQVSKRYSFEPSQLNEYKNNKLFEATLEPRIGYTNINASEQALNGFFLKIKNKTDKDIKIIWDETFFLNNGNTDGRFMFEGVKYIDRDKSNLPTIILAKSRFVELIYPNSKVSFENNSFLKIYEWIHKEIEELDSPVGIYLTVEIDGEKHTEKILFDFKVLNKY